MAGSRETAGFGDDDLDRLQAIRAIAALRQDWFDETTNGPVNEETIEQAAAFLSHDTRNLLAVLRGRLQLAEETSEDTHLESIEQTLDRLAAIIDDTVTVLRTGEHVSDPLPVSLAETAARAWEAVDADRATLRTTSMDPFWPTKVGSVSSWKICSGTPSSTLACSWSRRVRTPCPFPRY